MLVNMNDHELTLDISMMYRHEDYFNAIRNKFNRTAVLQKVGGIDGR